MMQKRSTIKQVAQLAGVSISTVSRYLNNSRKFSEDIQKNIQDAIDSLNYTPNANARSLKQNKTFVIGVIIPDMVVYSYMCRVIEQNLYDKHYSVIIGNSDYDPKRENVLLHNLFRQGVDGILLASCGGNSDYIRFIQDHGTPIVLFDRYQTDMPEMNYVLEQGKKCIRRITEFAISQGHRNIAYIKGPEKETVSAERFDEFISILDEHGLPHLPEYYYPSVIKQEHIRDVSNDIFDHLDEITLVITTNAKQIKHFIMAANERKILIPEQISITGFGLEEYKTLFQYPITCIIQNHKKIGEECVKLILDLLEDSKDRQSGKTILVESEFFIGESVKKIN